MKYETKYRQRRNAAVIGEETEIPSRNKSRHHIGPYGSSEEVGR